jgi:hypothetical protein
MNESQKLFLKYTDCNSKKYKGDATLDIMNRSGSKHKEIRFLEETQTPSSSTVSSRKKLKTIASIFYFERYFLAGQENEKILDSRLPL